MRKQPTILLLFNGANVLKSDTFSPPRLWGRESYNLEPLEARVRNFQVPVWLCEKQKNKARDFIILKALGAL